MNRRQFIGTLASVFASGTACTQRIRASKSVEKQQPNKPSVPKRPLGKTGIEVSVLIQDGTSLSEDPS